MNVRTTVKAGAGAVPAKATTKITCSRRWHRRHPRNRILAFGDEHSTGPGFDRRPNVHSAS